MKHLLLFVGWLWLAAVPTQAQEPTQPHRTELPYRSYSSDVQVLPLPADSSVVLLVADQPRGTFRDQYSFQKFDRQLKPLWTQPLEVPREQNLVDLSAAGTRVYALFQSEYAPEQFWLALLDGQTGVTETITFNTGKVRGQQATRTIYGVRLLAGKLLINLLVDDHLTGLLLDPATKKHQFLPAVREELPAEYSVVVDSAAQRAAYVVAQSNGVRGRLQVKQLRADGTLRRTDFVQPESERRLLAAQLLPGSDSARRLAGTYGLRDSRYAQGLFTAQLAGAPTLDQVRQSLRFYDFLNLKHFVDYLKPHQAQRLRNRRTVRRQNEQDLRLHYRVLLHDYLLPTPEGFALVGEIYTPITRNNPSGSSVLANFYYPGIYRPWTNNLPVDNTEFRTSHAILCGFDSTGTLQWDNAFVVKDVVSRNLGETIRLNPLPDGRRFVAAYLRENDFCYKIIDRSATSSNELTMPLQSNNQPDSHEKPGRPEAVGLFSWYGSRFLVSGYQNVRVRNGTDRDVFFMNVVSFE